MNGEDVNESCRLQVIGHRGCAGVEPENTLRGIRRAIEMGCGMVEVDVHLVEGELVVMHDFSVDRTTNGSGMLDEMGLKELRDLDAGEGERVPFLCEVLELCSGKCVLNIELKGAGTAGAVVHLLQYRGGADEVVISSFDWKMLERVRKGDAHLVIAVLVEDGAKLDAAFEKAEELRAVSLNVSVELLSPELVARAHAAGLTIAGFTVRSEKDLLKVKNAGADACFADDPGLVMSWR